MRFSSILQILVPKEKKFFPLFEQAADNLVKAAILLNKLLLIDNVDDRIALGKQIKEIENDGDHITHTIFEELNTTFITPFDREDIQTLTSTMDDVLDYINGVALKVNLFKPIQISEFSIQISELILQATREIKIAVSELKNLKYPFKIKEACISINDIENQADDIYHNAISSFFETEKDAIELIKKNEIIQTLEKATDKAEDVSDVLKSIIVKLA